MAIKSVGGARKARGQLAFSVNCRTRFSQSFGPGMRWDSNMEAERVQQIPAAQTLSPSTHHALPVPSLQAAPNISRQHPSLHLCTCLTTFSPSACPVPFLAVTVQSLAVGHHFPECVCPPRLPAPCGVVLTCMGLSAFALVI